MTPLSPVLPGDGFIERSFPQLSTYTFFSVTNKPGQQRAEPGTPGSRPGQLCPNMALAAARGAPRPVPQRRRRRPVPLVRGRGSARPGPGAEGRERLKHGRLEMAPSRPPPRRARPLQLSPAALGIAAAFPRYGSRERAPPWASPCPSREKPSPSYHRVAAVRRCPRWRVARPPLAVRGSVGRGPAASRTRCGAVTPPGGSAQTEGGGRPGSGPSARPLASRTWARPALSGGRRGQRCEDRPRPRGTAGRAPPGRAGRRRAWMPARVGTGGESFSCARPVRPSLPPRPHTLADTHAHTPLPPPAAGGHF